MAENTSRDSTGFLWCAGIENTFIVDPHPRTGKRLDEYELTGHYRSWEADIKAAASLGINTIRWGIPWHIVARDRSSFDWSWTDEVIGNLTETYGVSPIVDLIHYGTPEWMTSALLDPDFLPAFGDYVSAFSERYAGKVSYATPVNEPYTAAEFCGRRGVWPPYRTGDAGFVAVMIATSRAALEASRILKAHGISAVHVEVATGALSTGPELESTAESFTLRNELYWDLITGRVTADHPLWEWLLASGAQPTELDWFLGQGGEKLIDLQGVNYYPQWSYVAMPPSGDPFPLNGGPRLFEAHLRRFWQKYHLPLMITETSVRGGDWEQSAWLSSSVACVERLIGEEIDIRGYTWFPLIDMIDWEYRNGPGEPDCYRMELGLWTLDRVERRSAETYRSIIRRGLHG